MSAVLFPLRAGSRIDEADRILREVTAQTWPSSAEAMAAIGNARDYLVDALDEHARLSLEDAPGALDWSDYDPDLWIFGDGAQAAAIAAAEDKAHQGAVALVRVFAGYQRREAAMAGQGGTR